MFLANIVCIVRFEVFTAVTMRMPSSGMLGRVALVKTDVSKERITLMSMAIPHQIFELAAS
jgi:hypothetical protein